MADLNLIKDQFFVSCPRAMEQLLYDELENINKNLKLFMAQGGIEVEAKMKDIFDVILHSRLASRVYKKLFWFDAKKEKDIYFESKKYNWKGTFELSQTFKIHTIQGHSPNGKKSSHFRNSMFLGLQLKDAIVDRFRADTGERPSVDPEEADLSFLMYVEPYDNPYSTKERVSVLQDLVGIPLSSRGYRVESFQAPLRENLAAALVMSTKYDGSQAFIDAMTGSGTIITEAAMIAANIPPSCIKIEMFNEGKKPWSFLQHKFYTRDNFLQKNFQETIAAIDLAKLRENLKDKKLYAFDIAKFHKQMFDQNISAAGLAPYIKFKQEDATKVTIKETEGIFICNPPYGQRLGDEKELEELYFQLGENLKQNYKGFTAYIFTGNLALLKKISLRTKSKKVFFNGNIESRLAQYELF